MHLARLHELVLRGVPQILVRPRALKLFKSVHVVARVGVVQLQRIVRPARRACDEISRDMGQTANKSRDESR